MFVCPTVSELRIFRYCHPCFKNIFIQFISPCFLAYWFLFYLMLSFFSGMINYFIHTIVFSQFSRTFLQASVRTEICQFSQFSQKHAPVIIRKKRYFKKLDVYCNICFYSVTITKSNLKEAFYSAYKIFVILAYHWPIKMYTGLLLVI